MKRNETDPFLKRIITGDEKWVVYDNVMRKRSWSKRDEPAQSISKSDIHQKKVTLSVWWDVKSIVEMKEKQPELATRKGIILYQDNAKTHTSLVTSKQLLELDWEVMPHPPYSLDLAPSDYHLFRSL